MYNPWKVPITYQIKATAPTVYVIPQPRGELRQESTLDVAVLLRGDAPIVQREDKFRVEIERAAAGEVQRGSKVVRARCIPLVHAGVHGKGAAGNMSTGGASGAKGAAKDGGTTGGSSSSTGSGSLSATHASSGGFGSLLGALFAALVPLTVGVAVFPEIVAHVREQVTTDILAWGSFVFGMVVMLVATLVHSLVRR